MRLSLATILLGASALALGACTFTTSQQTELTDTLQAICAGATAGIALVTADGEVLNASSATQAKITQAGQLVQVNCSALPAAIAAIQAASTGTISTTPVTTTTTTTPTSPLPVLPSPTALVSAERTWAPKIGIPQATLDRIVKHYAR
jgi:hypothetical protein